jgi:hypothetical protein
MRQKWFGGEKKEINKKKEERKKGEKRGSHTACLYEYQSCKD